MSEMIFRAKPDGTLDFVGDFDGLYRSEADPWGQSGGDGDMAGYYRESRRRLCSVLRSFEVKGHGLEVGCGHGHVLGALRTAVPGVEWAGLDISAAALVTTRARLPELSFYEGSIVGWQAPHRFDVVILSQMLWYVLESLDDAFASAHAAVKPGGLLVVQQAFLKTEQRYGKEILDGFAGAIDYSRKWIGRLNLIEARYDDSGRHAHNDGLLVFRRV